MRPLLILGAGATAVDILDIVAAINDRAPVYECLGMLDDNPARHGASNHGVPILGPLALAADYSDALLVSALGSPGNFWKRAGILAALDFPRDRYATLVHPASTVSRFAALGSGVVAYPNCSIMADAALGDHVIVLSQCAINHECVIGDCAILATGVSLAGRVRVGADCYLGTGCNVIQDAIIGDRCLIGMGSTVLRDVPENSVMVGSPARFLRHTVAP
ncbi:MAG: putative acetyltransferase EpsM [bacterium ADurb.Bin429]|nr:MAG: putative acetyltransferase EpsM [bacterium ADurb.Bin429]